MISHQYEYSLRLVVLQQPDRLDPPVGLDPSAGEVLGHHGADAEQVDLGVVDGELQEDGAGVVVHPVLLLQLQELVADLGLRTVQPRRGVVRYKFVGFFLYTRTQHVPVPVHLVTALVMSITRFI